MFILHFNRIIRNKWVWGAFAILISIFFAFDFLFEGNGDDGRAAAGTAGQLGGKDVSGAYFEELTRDIRGFGRQRDNQTPSYIVNRRAWEIAAALRTADDDRFAATDDEVRGAIRGNRGFQDETGAFSLARYQALLSQNDVTPDRFESYAKRDLTLRKIARVLDSAAWVSPMELESAINDMTDRYTVRIATFHDKSAAGSVKLDDAALRKYYDEHTNSIALPDRLAVRYIAFHADAPARLAAMKVSDDELHDRYDATLDRFEVQTTNGVTHKTFEQARPVLLRELQLIASIEAYRTNILFRAYANETGATNAAASSRLDAIAAADKQTVHKSPYFAAAGARFVPGFMVEPTTFAPDATGFAAAAAELDPESADLRYGVVIGTNTVYLIERSAFSKAHIPTFAEAKDAIRPAALDAARTDAFKATLEKARAHAAAGLAKGQPFDAKLLAGASVTTSITFSVSTASRDAFPDVSSVVRAVMSLDKGTISEFVATDSPDRALLVYVADRRPGDAATAQMVKPQLREELASVSQETLPAAWQAWNLARIGFQATSAGASVKESADAGAVPEN